MVQNPLFLSLQEIANGHVFIVLRMMREYAMNHSLGKYRDELESITSDYELMLDYLGNGSNDPEREKIHSRISTRLDRCVRNIMLLEKTRVSPFYQMAKRKSGDFPLETETLRSDLEGFVSEQAMLGLLDEENKAAKTLDVYAQHVSQMSSYFHRVIVSPQWNEDMRNQMVQLLTSPTIDSFDAQLLVSAITLATLNHYDKQKILALVNIYRDSADMNIRQRALVGWVFAVATSETRHEEIATLCADDDVTREVADMQKQVMFCLNADKDNQTIQKDIIPELMKNQNLNITRFGITEKEDDPMEDILNPNATDERMEKLEDTMHRMEKMQKEGSDIYFGGFSQMKRFTFFNDTANWFWPFFFEHPDIHESLSKIGKAAMFKSMLTDGPFCESDKYSFLLTMKTVYERLPENVREMLDRGYELGPLIGDADRNSGDYIRRMYLQDMYRFFRLNMYNTFVRNPFMTDNSYLFVANRAFEGTKIDGKLAELALFMHKRNMNSCFKTIAERYINSNTDKLDIDYIHIASLYFMEYKNAPDMAYSVLRSAWDNGKLNDDATGLKLMGRIAMIRKDYETACECYKKLMELYPEKSNYALNYSVALMKRANYADALEILYCLDYENPSSNTTRALAWALMGDGKISQAKGLYDKLLKEETKQAEDFLNAAYCQWFMGKVPEAVSLFSAYWDTLDEDDKPSNWLTREFEKDVQMLMLYGIKPIDMLLMGDIVDKKVKGMD